MAYASEQIKEDAQRNPSDRPYTTAGETMNSTRGKVSMGRSQDLSGGGRAPGDPGSLPPSEGQAAPPVVEPGTVPENAPDAAAASVADPPPNETPAWPSDIATRFANHATDQSLSSVYAPEVTRGFERGGQTDMPLGQRDVIAPPTASRDGSEPPNRSAMGPAGAIGPTGSAYTRSQYGGFQPSTIKGSGGLDSLAHTGLTGAMRAYFAPQNPEEVQNAEQFAQNLFLGTIGAGEIDVALTAAAKFLEPRVPGAVAALAKFAREEGGQARVDLGLTPEDPLDRLARMSVDELKVLHYIAPDEAKGEVAAEIERRTTATRAADALAAAGKNADAQAVRDAVNPPAKAAPAASLPRELAGAKPNYRDTGPVHFESDVDKALYIVAQTSKSKNDAGYMTFLRSALPGKSDTEIRALARSVKRSVADAARVTEEGEPVRLATVNAHAQAGEAADSFDAIVGDAGKVASKVAPPVARTQRTALAMPESAVAPTDAAPARSGSIRMPKDENLGIPAGYRQLPEHLQAQIEQFAREHYNDIQVARGGAVPLSQVEQESLKIMVDAGVLAQTAPRTMVSAPGARALIKANIKVAGEREALMAQAGEVWPNVSDDLKARIAVKVFEQNSIQKVIAGARAEWGRLGQVWQTALDTGSAVQMRDTYKAIQKAVGKGNLDAVIGRLHDIENDPLLLGDPFAKQIIARRQMKFIDGLSNASAWEKLDEVYRNAILSIPVTHEAYVMGMTMYHEVEALTKLPTAVIDKFLAPLESLGLLGGRAKAVRGSGARYTFNQAVASIAAAQAGIPRGLVSFGRSLIGPESRAGLFEETGKYTFPRALKNVPVKGTDLTIPISDIINSPTKVINAYAEGLHEMGRYQSMWEQAAAIVEREMPGTSILSREFLNRAAEIVANPEAALAPKAPGLTAEATAAAQREAALQSAAMRDIADKAGKRVSLRGQQGGLAQKLRDIRDTPIPQRVPLIGGAKPLYRVMPFINIGFNIAQQGLEYSPLGFARVFTTVGPERSGVIARAGMGSLMWKFFLDKADAGEMTGSTPVDPNERAEWTREGKTPYSIKWNGQWYPIDRFEPLATTVKWMAGFNDAYKEMSASPDRYSGAALGVMAAKMAAVIVHGFTDMTWNIGLSQIGDIATAIGSGDPTKMWDAGQNYAGQQAASQTPFSGLLKRTAQAIDPYVRSPKGFAQQIEAMIPGFSALVPKSAPSRYGGDVKRPESQQGLQGMFNPLRGSPSSVDPVDQELMKHQIANPKNGTVKTLFMTLASQDIAGFHLDAEEGRLMQTYVGRAAHQALADLFADKSAYNGQQWSQLKDEPTRVKAIQATITQARRTGRAVTADIIVQAATTAPEVARGMEMRLSLIGDNAERAMYIEGIQRQGKLSPQASALLSESLRRTNKTSPTVAQFLAAAPGVREYLAIPAFVSGDPSELKQVEQERSLYSSAATLDRLDGTTNARAFYDEHPTLQKYARIDPRSGSLVWTVRENPARARYRTQHKDLAPFLSGLTYSQEGQ